MSIETSEQISQTETGPTPLLDRIIPQSDDTTMESCRAMLLRLGQTVAEVEVFAETGEAADMGSIALAKEDLESKIPLFLQDIERSLYGVIYDEEGEIINTTQLASELVQARLNEAYKSGRDILQVELDYHVTEAARLREAVQRLDNQESQEKLLVHETGEAISSKETTVENITPLRRRSSAWLGWSALHTVSAALFTK